MGLQSLDAQLLLLINHGVANAVFDVLMPALSQRGYLLIVPFLFFMLTTGAGRRNSCGGKYLAAAFWTIVIACCAVYLAGWAEDALKAAVARVRPCRAIEGVRLIVACPKSFSTPSGHAISSFAFAVPLFYLTREYIALAWRFYPLFLAAAIAFSRVYLGVHYPTDVLVGTALGAAIGMALSLGYQLILKTAFGRR